MADGECVKVVVRCRPSNAREKALNSAKIVKIDRKTLAVSLIKGCQGHERTQTGAPCCRCRLGVRCGFVLIVAVFFFVAAVWVSAEEPKTFTYDNVYDDDSRQKDVYGETAFPLVKSVMEGYNGQTGASSVKHGCQCCQQMSACSSLTYCCGYVLTRGYRHHLRLWPDWMRVSHCSATLACLVCAPLC
jgi:hypothetical protein